MSGCCTTKIHHFLKESLKRAASKNKHTQSGMVVPAYNPSNSEDTEAGGSQV